MSHMYCQHLRKIEMSWTYFRYSLFSVILYTLVYDLAIFGDVSWKVARGLHFILLSYRMLTGWPLAQHLTN